MSSDDALLRELQETLLDDRDRFAAMSKDDYGYEELRVAIIRKEELLETWEDNSDE